MSFPGFLLAIPGWDLAATGRDSSVEGLRPRNMAWACSAGVNFGRGREEEGGPSFVLSLPADLEGRL